MQQERRETILGSTVAQVEEKILQLNKDLTKNNSNSNSKNKNKNKNNNNKKRNNNNANSSRNKNNGNNNNTKQQHLLQKLKGEMECFKLGNYDASSQKGCYIVHFDSDWIVDKSPFDAEDYDCTPEETEQIPDISIDVYNNNLLSVINTSNKYRTYFISVGHPVMAADGMLLEMGETTVEANNENENENDSINQKQNPKNEKETTTTTTLVTKKCITFVLVVEPETVMDIGYLQLQLDDSDAYDNIDLESDIKDLDGKDTLVTTAVTADGNSTDIDNNRYVLIFCIVCIHIRKR